MEIDWKNPSRSERIKGEFDNPTENGFKLLFRLYFMKDILLFGYKKAPGNVISYVFSLGLYVSCLST